MDRLGSVGFLTGGAFLTYGLYAGVADALCIGIVYGAVAVGLLYVSLVRLVNSTQIQLNHEELTVKHGPLPVPWKKKPKLASVVDNAALCN